MATVPLTATFATAGAFTWTAPPGVTLVTVACTGGGGGGAGVGTSSGDNGGGGGGGAAALEPSVPVTPGVAYALTVGIPGIAGGSASGGVVGGTGGTSVFTGDSGVTVTALGGQGGGTGSAAGAGPGAPGGAVSGNTVAAAGGAGDDGIPATSGGGGGGAAGVATGVLAAGITGAYLSASQMGAADLTGAMSLWETWTGRHLPVVRDYAGPSDFSIQPRFTMVTGSGRKLCLTLKPAYNPVSATDLANLDTMLATMKAAGADVEVTLWHEPFFGGLTAAQYIAMVQYYGPTVRQYYPLAFVMTLAEVLNHSGLTYYPGDAYIDKIICDFYSADWALGRSLDSIATLADNASPPKPFGLWEFNALVNGGNFLTQPDSGFENGGSGSIGDWTTTGNCSIAVTTAQARTGAASLALTSSAAGGMSASHCLAGSIATLGLPCVPGDSILASAWYRAAASARTVTTEVSFYTSAGAFISTLNGTGVPDTTTGWTQATATVTAPATAAFCRGIYFVGSTAAAGEVHYVDDVSITNLNQGYTTAQVNAFYGYVQSYFSGRASAGKQNANLLQFNGAGANSTLIQDPSDFRIPLYGNLAAGGVAGIGFPGSPASGATAGAGGGGTFPGGAGGAGSTSGAGAGPGGLNPGGGGGGALSTGTGRFGGRGGIGQVVITWTMTDTVTLVNDTAGAAVTFTAPQGATSVTAQAWGAGGGGFTPPGGAAPGSFLIGASIGNAVYGTNEASAISHFNQLTGLNLASTVQKIYLQVGSWPSAVDATTQAIINSGAKLYISVKPSKTQTAGERTNLADYIQMIQAATSIPVDVCLWQEPNNGDFTNAAAYIAYVAYYAPVLRNPTAYVTTGSATPVPIVYNPCVGTVGCDYPSPTDYYPGDSVTDKVYADYYASACGFGSGTTVTRTLAPLAAFADGHSPNPIPFGLGEWNCAAGGSTLTVAQWNAYVTYLTTFFQARLSAGKPVGDLIFWMGNHALNNPVMNMITATADYKIPGGGNAGGQGLQTFVTALQTSSPSGSAGGGGGEYAAETTLAVTGLRNYAIAVGAGTADISGTATTIAGDSVTVTAHGGSAATSASAGGAGGTGSANTTHHDGGAGGAGSASGGGGGGGGSGGSAAGGNAGSPGAGALGGDGGTAVTGGGPGGKGGGTSFVNGHPPPGGPGGGGGGKAGNGTTDGPGFDGQITLTSFATGTSAFAGLPLAPLAFSGTAKVGFAAGSFPLAPLAFSGSGLVGALTLIQTGPSLLGGGSPLTFTNPTAAGTNLVAQVVSGGTTTLSLPAGWVQDAAQNSGGGAGRCEIWHLPGNLNPGGITTVAFTGGTSVRGNLMEWSAPAGTIMVRDGTAGTNSGTTPVTSFTVSTPGSAATGDLVVAVFENQFSIAPASTWGGLGAAWSTERSQAVVTDSWRTVYLAGGATAGIQTAVSTFGTSTNQTGWSAAIAAYTLVPVNTCSGALQLSPLAVAAAGTSQVTGGTVVTSGGLAMAPVAFQSPSLATTYPADQLPVAVEIQVNGTWTDITGYAYQRDGITITGRGRPDEASTAQPAQCTVTLDNRDGSFTPGNTAGQFYPYLTRNIQLRVSVVNAVTAQSASYTGYRFWGEVPSWPPLWNPNSTDIYVPVAAVGVLQRMQQSRYQASAVGRYYNEQVNTSSAVTPAGYWPCEDGGAAGSFAAGLPGGSPMTFTGTPGLAADSSVAGSAPFAQLNSSVWTGIPGAFTSGGVTFSVPGTYTWICPGDVTSILAECWGGGGGGANGRPAGGGAGGEYAADPAVIVTPGLPYTITVGAGGAGGAGDTQDHPGGGGKKSVFSGDAVTVTAHGGAGAPNNSSGTANGGTGSGNHTHHDGGGGAAGGGAAFGGAGGGSSGGTSAAGHNGSGPSGHNGGAGGTAVAGGGPGGAGGNGGTGLPPAATPGSTPSPPPGGGGGGGGFRSDTNYGRSGGNGQSGQVQLSFGSSTRPAANVLRAVIDIPQGGGTDGAYLLHATTNGTMDDIHLVYHTGGNLQLIGKQGANVLLDSGSHSFSANGTPMLVSAELTQSGSSVKWKLTAIKPGAAAVIATYTGTVTGAHTGSVTQINVNDAPGHLDTVPTGVGHVTVQYVVDPIVNLSQALAAYNGELAGTRFVRLCQEQRIPVTLTGNAADTPRMGPQPPGNLVALLQDCENADLGLMFERRDAFGMGYRTRVSMQNQAPGAVLDYSAQQLAPPLAPTCDDLLTRNDILATRGNGTTTGTTYEAMLQTGPLSTADPPAGAGLYAYPVTVNLFTDTQLAQFATWLLSLGTVDEFRYPLITVNMVRIAATGGPFAAAAGLDIGDQLQIINQPAWLPPGPVNQLCYGFAETISAFAQWTITINAVPADPWSSTGALPTW